MTNLDSILKILNFVNKGPYSKASFPSKHVWMWELDGRRLGTKELMFSNCGLEKNLESPLDCKKIKPVNPKGDQPWIFLGRTVAESEVPILWLPDMMSQLTEKDCDAGQGGEGGNRGWDGWMASWTLWTWILANPRRQWRTGRPAALKSIGVANSCTQVSSWTTTTGTVEDNSVASYQTKHTLSIKFTKHTPWHLPKGVENLHTHKNLHTVINSSFTHNCQSSEAIRMSFSRWIDK